MAMAGRYSGARREAVRMAVGPSAPPMTPMAAATSPLKPRASASKKAVKMPNCAPAPISMEDGRAISGPKSVIAPMPRKMMDG